MFSKKLLQYVSEALRWLAREDLAKTRGTQRTWEEMTTAYQVELRDLYEDWIDDLAEDVDGAEDDGERAAILAAALLTLENKMKLLGRRRIREGFTEGLGEAEMTGSAQNALFIQTTGNDRYVGNSLIPFIDMRVRNAIATPGFVGLGTIGMINLLTPVTARVESYAGMMWGAIQWGAGEASSQQDDRRVMWIRDPHAEHCATCLDFGDREYPSFDDMLAISGGAMPGVNTICDGNCRCWLEYIVDGEFARGGGPPPDLRTFEEIEW